MKNQIICITLLLMMGSIDIQAQADGDSLLKAGEYERAIKIYNKYLKKNEADSLRWFRIANAYKQTKKYEEAANAFNNAITYGFYPGYTYMEVSKVHALNEDEAKMYAALDSSKSKGSIAFKTLETDTAFDKYRASEKFSGYIEAFKLQAFPCMQSEKARLFDFWIGEWNVFVSGNKVGENIIKRAEGGCAIHESYTTPGAYSGQSINFLDPKDNLWKQYWVGSAGDIRDYVEQESSEGKIVFLAEYLSAGKENLSKMTFTLQESGDVRQYIENSTDNGNSWAVSFDGLYTKQKPSE